MGPKTAAKVGDLIKINRSLRVIDLEGNNLTNGEKTYLKEEPMGFSGRDNSGIEKIFDALKVNDTLLSLNLCDCNLDNECSEYILKMLKYNTTIINIDLDRNPKINKIDNVREI